MKNKRFLLLWACLLLATAVRAAAGDTLSIRLVEATHEGQGIGRGLADVAQLLQENLPFKSFQLQADRSIGLPANGAVELSGGYTARCSGDAGNLKVSIVRKGQPGRIDSTVALRKGKPVILGGLPADGGKMIVILLLR